MTFEPILNAPANIQIHAFAAMISLGLGPVIIYRQRRDRLHKQMGYVWVVAMLITAFSSFTIHSFALIGPFSPIHFLALLAIWSIWHGLRAVFAGDIITHRASMFNLYWRGVVIASLFTVLPGRRVNQMVFSETPEFGYIVVALGAFALIVHGLFLQRRTMA